MLNIAEYFPITDPTLIFFVVLLIILFAPIIMGKLRIPHIIGMVLAGILVGKYGLNILERDASFELFGKVGLYYIMFLAALEMDKEGMKKNNPECGCQHAFAADSPHHAGGARRLVLQSRWSALLGTLHRQVCRILRSDDIPDSATHKMVSAPVQRFGDAVYLRDGDALHECGSLADGGHRGRVRCLLRWSDIK